MLNHTQLHKELSSISTDADDLSISQKAVRLTHLSEKDLKHKVSAKRKDLMLELKHAFNQKVSEADLSLKVLAAIISYQFFKKSIPLDVRTDSFEKHLQKLTSALLRIEVVRNNKMKFKW